MSEFTGGDETLFSLWPEQFISRQNGLDWSTSQQILPVVLFDDGRVALKSDNGQIRLLDGLQGVGTGEDILLPIPGLEFPAAELPTLSDSTIKSMLVHGNFDAELPLVGEDMAELSVGKHLPDLSSKYLPELAGKDMPSFADDSISDLTEERMTQSPTDVDLKPLALFRCHYCNFSSADVPSLMHHMTTDHETDVESEVRTELENHLSVVEEMETPSNEDSQEVPEQARSVVVYLCSECNENFNTVEECRDHMITDHSMVFKSMDDDEAKSVSSASHVSPSPPPPPSPSPTPPSPTPPSPTPPSPTHPPPTTSQLTPSPPTPSPNPLAKAPSPPPSPKPPPFKVLKKPREVRHKDFDPEFEAKPHKCPFCIRKFQFLSVLEMHVECHLSDDSRKFCCPHCSMLFNKWVQCAIHLWKEHKVDVDLLTCKVCNEYKTTTPKKLESHAKIHSKERPYKCTVCDKGFKQRPQLINHMASVHNKEKDNSLTPKWYMAQKCEICFKTYADSKCLKKHMQTVHNKLKPYKCQICNHMCAHKAMLQSHVRQHTGEKPFTCKLCSFRTGDHNSLRRHMMRHTGKRPYRCPHCSYSCIQSSSLKSHVLNRHPGQGGTYICKECYFATVSEQSYKNHMSDHRLNLIPPNGVEVFPENVAAAHLVYRSLGASPSQIHCDASTTSRDGMKQTITISIPPEESAVTDDEDTTQYLLGDVLDTGGITIPAEPEQKSLISFNSVS